MCVDRAAFTTTWALSIGAAPRNLLVAPLFPSLVGQQSYRNHDRTVRSCQFIPNDKVGELSSVWFRAGFHLEGLQKYVPPI